MHVFSMILFAIVGLFLSGVCTTPFDILRSKTEDLSPMFHHRATWRDPWLNIVPRGVYTKGAGYVRSTFTIERSEPTIDEELWDPIQRLSDNNQGACAGNYTQVFNGMHEDQYVPEMFKLVGPLICQDDLPMYFQSEKTWVSYYRALEKRNIKSVTNRVGNVYRTYVPKASANGNFNFVPGSAVYGGGVVTPQSVPMTTLGGGNTPTSELTQEMLDWTALELMEEGADQGDTDAWISRGNNGPEFPLYIGAAASQRIFLNNAELRADINHSYEALKDMNPVLRRLGASGVLKNFRHVINTFPARWTNCTMTNTTVTINGVAITVPRVNGGTSSTSNPLLRVPTWLSAAPAGARQFGAQVTVNPDWRDPALANFESCEVLHPEVMTQEVLMPVNSMPGMKLNPQNYFGEWDFVTGNDALLGFANCAGITDPMKKQGRHFAEYRHSFAPGLPVYGRMILFSRCSSSFDTVTCS